MRKKIWKIKQIKLKIISTNPSKSKTNVSKSYTGNLNPSIKKMIFGLFELNITKNLRETCSLNMSINDKTGQSKGYAFMSALKHACVKFPKLNEVKFYGSQIQSARGHAIVVSSPAKNQPVVVNKNLEKKIRYKTSS